MKKDKTDKNQKEAKNVHIQTYIYEHIPEEYVCMQACSIVAYYMR